MITIVKGNQKKVCSYKTYDEQFRQLGYLPASETKKEAKTKVASSSKEVKEDKVSEEDKIGSKYGTKKKTSSKSKKEE